MLLATIVFLVPILYLLTNLILFLLYLVMSTVFHLEQPYNQTFIYSSIFGVFFGLLILLIVISSKSIHYILHRIEEINKTIKKISQDKKLPQKLLVRKNDEIGWLAESINVLIDRLAHKELMLNAELSFKKEYLNRLSHDINTPLTAMRLELFLLQRDGILGEKSVLSLSEQIDYISKLVNQLNQEDLESVKKSYIIYENVDIANLTDKMIKKWTYIFSNNNIKIKYTVKDEKLVWRSNELWIERILDNVFQNAQRHSKASSIDVMIKNGAIVIQDNGIGFNVEKSHQGLGMLIIKETCEILKIKCELSSTDRGTTYTFQR
ncbi:HAMP domain-containing sensor histidine kinase [Bacillus cereus group sp. BfR-BA-01431]|uniref:HAMP domain-containing sensor histidine kinase n=2 Tax=unclassified Bacillus cereus group TaxID=2750818 RepID=UPI001F57B187|nr:HAMP domain-containing sensor histidine kinase [Bacillus cereus group sp. BfR-BA-01431]